MLHARAASSHPQRTAHREARHCGSFFTHILAHEMSHGLGPHTIPGAGGSTSSVSKELQEYHSALEEAKADVAGAS
jgi:hypothetical protein